MPEIRPTDAEMVPRGERLADAARRVLSNDGSVPAYRLMGELIEALAAWEDAMAERFNRDVGRH